MSGGDGVSFRVGTGYLVTADLVLTASHVVPEEGLTELEVRTQDPAEWHTVQPVWRDGALDALLLRMATPRSEVAEVAWVETDFETDAVWQSSAGLSTTLYRTLSTPVHGLALRHVLSPSASISYAPDFPSLQFTDSLGRPQDRFQGFGGLGIFSGRKSARASFSLDQRFQAKYTRGDKITRLDNLLTWTTSGAYDFLWREEGLKHPLSNISSGLRLQPPGYVNADAGAAIDPYSQRPLRALQYNVTSNFSNRGGGKPQQARLAADATTHTTAADAEVDQFHESWSLSLAYSYNGGYEGPKWQSHELVNAVLRYQLTENWVFDYSAGYDITKRNVLLQRYNLTRRIHCWDAIFSRSFTPGGEAEYYFRLGIRDQKEIYYARGTRVQNFGGIQ